jgi:hypothetical protein
VVGVKRLLRFSPHHRPGGIEKSPAPPVHCRDRKLRFWFLEAYRSFVQAYRWAYRRLGLLGGEDDFPPGGVPPAALLAAAD